MINSNPKICIPIQLQSTQAVIEFMQENKNRTDLFEIWLDQIQDLNLEKIFANKVKPILCVCKGEKEKGKFRGNELEKLEILKQAIQYGADYIDLDYGTDPLLLQDLIKNKGNCKLILSYHNFTLTPDLKSLLEIIQNILKNKPDIIKIATMANSYKDTLIILNLAQSLATAQIPFITIAMSPYGKISRILSPLMGGEMMFAPLEIKSSTASGQIETERLRELWKEFS